jgi:formylglycine-generating enzyme required for sulfatase activity
MGVVFLAEDVQLKRPVALKVLKSGAADNPAARERFVREAQAAAALEHEHIVTIYQVGEAGGVPFLAMQWLKGMSLEERLKRPGALSVPQVLRLGRQIACGLAAAHARGLVHRDIKPGNLWLEAEHGGRIRILDFGLARAVADEVHLTQPGAIVGTPAYMAPEQARGEKVDHRCDLFSLGVVLYRLATGQLPFRGNNTVAVLAALTLDTPAPPRQVNPAVPPPLSDLIVQLLAKDPAGRPASAGEVADRLQALERPPALPPDPSRTEARSFAPSPRAPGARPPARRRVRRAAAAAAAALAVVLAGVVLLLPAPNGVIRLEINDPAIEATVAANGTTIKGAGRGDIRVEPGARAVKIKRGDLEFETDQFLVKKGETVTLKIEFLQGKIQVVKDGVPFAEGVAPLPKRFTNPLGMEFVLVPRGKSWLGGGGGKVGTMEVQVAHDFYLGKYPVTQEEWEKVTGNNPSDMSRAGASKDRVQDVPDADLKRFPVENISWHDAHLFVKLLNAQEKEAGWLYRLPTDVEWEYACRGGPMTNKAESAFDYYFEEPTNELLPEQAHFNKGFLGRPCKVGSYKPNRLGLYDMHGNVGEFCAKTIPDGQEPSPWVARGGGFVFDAGETRAAHSRQGPPSHRAGDLGLRLARVPAGTEPVTPRPPREKKTEAPPP